MNSDKIGGSEVDQWRAQRLAQMQQAQAQGQGQGHGQPSEEQRKRAEAEAEQKRMLLNRIMSGEAREKLSNIRLVKPERAAQVEAMVLSAAQSGQLEGRVTEAQLKDLLQKVTEQAQAKTSVTIQRRRRAFDDDDDDDDDDDQW